MRFCKFNKLEAKYYYIFVAWIFRDYSPYGSNWYENEKSELLRYEGWRAQYNKLSKKKFKRYNRDALLMLLYIKERAQSLKKNTKRSAKT